MAKVWLERWTYLRPKNHYFGDKIVPTCRKSAYDKINGAHSNFYAEHVFDGLSSSHLRCFARI